MAVFYFFYLSFGGVDGFFCKFFGYSSGWITWAVLVKYLDSKQ